jgi:hypothetical protein
MTTFLMSIVTVVGLWSCAGSPPDQADTDQADTAEIVLDLERPLPVPRGQCGDRCSGAADCGAILCTTCAAPAGAFKGTCMTSLPLGFVAIGVPAALSAPR